jgi:hypothetical protein
MRNDFSHLQNYAEAMQVYEQEHPKLLSQTSTH